MTEPVEPNYFFNPSKVAETPKESIDQFVKETSEGVGLPKPNSLPPNGN